MTSGNGFEDAGFAREFVLPGHPALARADDPDFEIRLEAFEAVRSLIALYGGAIPAAEIERGFRFRGSQIFLATRAKGIFKPQQMQTLLSIKTVLPRKGRAIWYEDQRNVHQQIYDGVETVDYAFQGKNPDRFDNRYLLDAMERRLPLIYFVAVAPALYEAILPAFIVNWDREQLRARVSFGIVQRADEAPPKTDIERRYALRNVKQRLHQDTFRAAVIQAYGSRCAISGLPEPLLLDAAHIISDGDEHFGQPVVQNGLPLSKLHHAAFDKHLIGIDPDYRIHVSPRLSQLKDGPILEALKQVDGGKLLPPKRHNDAPDPARLAMRFEAFLKSC